MNNEEVLTGEPAATHVSAEDVWRQGGCDGGGAGHIEQDAPDDKVSEGLIDLTEQFSADLRLDNGVPATMLYEFAL